jgi:outer membrane protein OmpA-like peptidoglycan-associated protein
MFTRTTSIVAVAGCLLGGSVNAQQPAPAPQDGNVLGFRAGVLGGINFNYIDAPTQRYVDVAGNPSFASHDFSKSNAFAPYGGVMAEYLFTRVFGLGLRATFDDRLVSKNVDGSEFTPQISYISFEPSVRLNIASGFHFNVGPVVSIPINKVYDYTPGSGEGATTLSNIDLKNVRDVAFGAGGGFGYDIPLNTGTSSARWYVTPFIEGSWLYDQKTPDIAQSDVSKWSTLTARAGIQFKIGEAPAPVAQQIVEQPPVLPRLDVTLVPPRTGVLAPRDLVEHMPMVNYLFFDENSSAIPARYTQLAKAEAAGFDETRLIGKISAGGLTADAPESRQIEVYRNILNVFGSRMMKYPNAEITLVGSAPTDDKGLAMAESVKSYLVNTFGIKPDRIKTSGQLRPPHASGTRVTPKEDLPLVAEENRRVEMLTDDPRLLEPVALRTTMTEPLPNNIDIALKTSEPITNWAMTVTDGKRTMSYGPYRWTSQRINAAPILGDARQGSYVAKVSATLQSGQVITREVPFELRKTERPAVTADRYSILFDYDESKTVELYEDFLRRTVAPALTNGSYVLVHGHTDMIGDEDYNAALSVRRAAGAAQILSDETKKLGRNVTFDVEGYGETSERTPYANTAPEGREYNRTVVIDVFPNQTILTEH